jgi:hypothetical protein
MATLSRTLAVFAHAGPAEQADLAAAHERAQQVDHLDARLQDLGLGVQLGELRRLVVDRPPGRGVDGSPLVDGLAEQVEHAAQGLLAHRNLDRAAGVPAGVAAPQPVRGREGDAPHLAAAEVLGHLARERDLLASYLDLGLDRVVNVGQVLFRKLCVERGANDLDDRACARHDCNPARNGGSVCV